MNQYSAADIQRIKQRQAEEHKLLLAERRRASLQDGNPSGENEMGAYLARRKEGLEEWENREGELLEKLKHTVTKQSQLGKQLQARTRKPSELMA